MRLGLLEEGCWTAAREALLSRFKAINARLQNGQHGHRGIQGINCSKVSHVAYESEDIDLK